VFWAPLSDSLIEWGMCHYVKDMWSESGVAWSGAELLWSGRELTTKVGK